jgi:hypothetical protein
MHSCTNYIRNPHQYFRYISYTYTQTISQIVGYVVDYQLVFYFLKKKQRMQNFFFLICPLKKWFEQKNIFRQFRYIKTKSI